MALIKTLAAFLCVILALLAFVAQAVLAARAEILSFAHAFFSLLGRGVRRSCVPAPGRGRRPAPDATLLRRHGVGRHLPHLPRAPPLRRRQRAQAGAAVGGDAGADGAGCVGEQGPGAAAGGGAQGERDHGEHPRRDGGGERGRLRPDRHPREPAQGAQEGERAAQGAEGQDRVGQGSAHGGGGWKWRRQEEGMGRQRRGRRRGSPEGSARRLQTRRPRRLPRVAGAGPAAAGDGAAAEPVQPGHVAGGGRDRVVRGQAVPAAPRGARRRGGHVHVQRVAPLPRARGPPRPASGVRRIRRCRGAAEPQLVPAGRAHLPDAPGRGAGRRPARSSPRWPRHRVVRCRGARLTV